MFRDHRGEQPGQCRPRRRIGWGVGKPKMQFTRSPLGIVSGGLRNHAGWVLRLIGNEKRPSTPETSRPQLAVGRANKFFPDQPKSNLCVGETTVLSDIIPALACEMRVTRQSCRKSSQPEDELHRSKRFTSDRSRADRRKGNWNCINKSTKRLV
jgi:hypothetical protein